jgi:hypothetical protein
MSAVAEDTLLSKWQRISFAMHALTVAAHLCELAGLSSIADRVMVLHLEAQAEREKA